MAKAAALDDSIEKVSSPLLKKPGVHGVLVFAHEVMIRPSDFSTSQERCKESVSVGLRPSRFSDERPVVTTDRSIACAKSGLGLAYPHYWFAANQIGPGSDS
jgi:hypothetical protein